MSLKNVLTYAVALLALLLTSPAASAEGDDIAAAIEAAMPPVAPGPEMTLQEALRSADSQNLTLEATREELRKAQAQLQYGVALLLPVAGGNIQWTHNDHEDSVSFDMGIPGAPATDIIIRQQAIVTGALQASIPIVNFENWWTIRTANIGVDLATLTVENIRQQLLLATAQAFFVALQAKALIDVNKAQIIASAHHLKVATARFEAGTGLRIDVIRAQTDLEKAKQDLLSAILAFDNARDSLGVLTGRDDLPMPTDAAPVQAPTETESELVEVAIQNREDVKIGAKQTQLAEQQLGTVWTRFLPTIDAVWQLQHQFTDPVDFGSSDQTRWLAIFTLSVPIYDQFRYATLDQRRAEVRQAEFQEQNTRLESGKEVRTARRQYLTALASVDIAERGAKLTHEALALAEASFSAGTGSSLEVTDARRTATAADLNLISQRLRAQIALLVLLRAIGEDMSEIGSQ